VVAVVRDAGGRPVVLDRVAPEDGIEHEIVDVAVRSDVEAAVAASAERAGGLDAVVAAAGIDRCGALADVPAEEWERVIAVNLLGTASVVRAAVPHLQRSNGTVVTVASTLGLKAVSDATAYCASKFAVVGFTRALTAELKGRVRVTLLVPGGMQTAFFDDRAEQYRPGPDAKLNSPHDVAAAVLMALVQPAGCEIRELVITSSEESSWP
jgi:NAD(P)-dependent dehydrogenase (short-subunit alcohol dehydrogenase family)